VHAPSRGRRLVVLPVLLLLVVPGCSSPSQEVLAHAVAGSVPVTFRSADGVRLAGRLFGDADLARTGVVFAHMLPADQSSWFAFADRVAGEGYLALTFDFRGYCPGGDAGCSEGDKEVSADATDLAAAVAFLRSRGVQTVAVVGASMGGTAALIVAADQGERIAAVITLSAPQSIEGLVAGPDVLARISAATLFLAGEGDGTAASAAQAFSDQAHAPSRLEIVTSDDHGTALVTGNQAEIVRNLILSELAQYAPA
jgi:pimeloyl-ACP methyl ester carboxylesterase